MFCFFLVQIRAKENHMHMGMCECLCNYSVFNAIFTRDPLGIPLFADLCILVFSMMGSLLYNLYNDADTQQRIVRCVFCLGCYIFGFVFQCCQCSCYNLWRG